nr:MAG TPA: hypothetical protein [Bacteriophage sp.]
MRWALRTRAVIFLIYFNEVSSILHFTILENYFNT